MAYEYDSLMGLGALAEDPPLPTTVAPRPGVVRPCVGADCLEPVPTSGDGARVALLGLGIGALLLMGAMILVAPWVIGAVSGAVMAPEGKKKYAAKWGAVAGGVSSMLVNGLGYALSLGSTNRSVTALRYGLGAITPIIAGGYIGYRENEKASS